MNDQTIEGAVAEICAAVLGRPVGSGASRATEAGWDSLKHIQIIFAVEAHFGVLFTEEEIPTMDSVARLTEYLGQLRGS